MAIEAAQLAEQRKMERQAEHRRLLELELQQTRYDDPLPNAATPLAIRTTGCAGGRA
jgi:hypothetical protein